MKKRIVVLTATRAEYGLLSPVIKKLMGDKELEINVVATGMHLSPAFGMTYREIEADGVPIDQKFEILMDSDTATAMSKSMALALISFSEYFERIKPDALLVLGDRYETLAVCCAAMNARIPIVHLYGGETTEGAIDEAIRHSITKMSYLHFTSTQAYRRRVIQLGENPSRVFCVGSLGVENALKSELITREDILKELEIPEGMKYVLVTYHPVTLDNTSIRESISAFLEAIQYKNDFFYVMTKANSDTGGRVINQMIASYAAEHKNVKLYDSLGAKRYLSAVKYSEMVIGNSSSGIVEVPSFGIPTINIGDRQKGRIKAESVIDCRETKQDIIEALDKAETEDYRAICRNVRNPYEGKNTSEEIVRLIKSELFQKAFSLKKIFYDWGETS